MAEDQPTPGPARITSMSSALDVEELDTNLYRSKMLWTPARARGVFGGQVIGQAVMAALGTVKPGYALHSLHCYFLLAGDETVPIIYTVTRVRDGRSYATRLVTAAQRDRPIFVLLASYQTPEPGQPQHQLPPPPSVPPPHSCPLNEEHYKATLRAKPHLPERVRRALEDYIEDRQLSPIEIRDAMTQYGDDGLPIPGVEQRFWMRAKERIDLGKARRDGEREEETRAVEYQKAVVAYMSDFMLLSTVPKAQGIGVKIAMMASLDHSMWFYDLFDVSEWLLYTLESPRSSHGRGLVNGRLYKRDGTLVALVAQEGLVRRALPSAPDAKAKAKL